MVVVCNTKSRQYPTETMRDTDNTYDLVPHADPQAKSQLHSMEQTARSIALFVNTDKTEFLHFK